MLPEEREKRVQEIIEMRRAAMPYSSIGFKFRISRERVRQILKIHAPELAKHIPIAQEYRYRLPRVTVTCARIGCGKTWEQPSTSKKKLCSTRCRRLQADKMHLNLRGSTRKEYSHAVWEWRKKHDPERVREFQERAKKKHDEKMRTDPAYKKRFIAYHKEYGRKKWLRIKSNPVALEAYREKQRKFYQENRERIRDYYRRRYHLNKKLSTS